MPAVNGLNADGSYYGLQPGLTPIVQSAVPCWPLTGTTSFTNMTSINIPPLNDYGFGPDSELIIAVTWSCNSSANAKTVQAMFGATNINFQDVQTTNTTNEWLFRISCRGNTSQQVISAGLGLGGTTAALQTMTVDFTQTVYLTLWGLLANAADNITIQRYSVWLSNAPSYPVKRMKQGEKWFYGANAHYDDMTGFGGSVTTAQMISGLQQLGMTVVRMSYENTDPSLNSLATVAQALIGTNLKMYCCIDLDLTTPLAAGATEAQCYQLGWTAAMKVVNRLKPLGVTIYECGNELDGKNSINIVGDQGCFPSSFSVAKWPMMRGIINGAVDAVQKMGCLAACNAGVFCGIGCTDMLWYGTSPDGKSGFDQVRWDITAFHSYQSWGDQMSISRAFSNPWMNLLDYLNKAYRVPIYISEFNGDQANTQAQNLAWTNRTMTEYYNNRYKYNIMGVNLYQLYQGNPWGIIGTPGTPGTLSVQGTGVQSFIAANPDSGT